MVTPQDLAQATGGLNNVGLQYRQQGTSKMMDPVGLMVGLPIDGENTMLSNDLTRGIAHS